jgi:hypothetical protein
VGTRTEPAGGPMGAGVAETAAQAPPPNARRAIRAPRSRSPRQPAELGPATRFAHGSTALGPLPGRDASFLLAFCDMRALYLRNVPDDVVERLERLAASEGMSVNAVAVRELAAVSRRADNPALLGRLPDHQVEVGGIVSDLEAERAGR